jgi:Holliday junction resolvase
VVAGAILAAAIVVLALRRFVPAKAADGDAAEKLRQREAELAVLREAKVASDRGLAVAEEKASRIPGLDASLREARELVERLREEKTAAERALSAKSEAAIAEVRAAKGKVEEALATKSEAVERLEVADREVRGRLAAAEKAQADLASRYDALKNEKAKVEEALATKSEAVGRLEAADREVRDRLGAGDKAQTELVARCDALKIEKSNLESKAAESAVLLAEKSDALERLRREHGEVQDALKVARSEPPELRAQLATLQETLSQERKQSEEKLALLNDAKERLTEQFKVLAEEVMGRHGETFKQQNKEQLDGLLTPLREQLTVFQAGLQTAHVESSKDRERLAEQIRSLVTTGTTMTNETRNLTQALRGEAQTQGAWGEMILSTILQRSGLREGEEYVTQESHSTDEGARLRPDVIVKLPDDKRIVIDSKVSLSAFTDYVNEGDPVAKAGHLTRHVASMRGHIKGLSRKEYHQVTGLDFVIMFVPWSRRSETDPFAARKLTHPASTPRLRRGEDAGNVGSSRGSAQGAGRRAEDPARCTRDGNLAQHGAEVLGAVGAPARREGSARAPGLGQGRRAARGVACRVAAMDGGQAAADGDAAPRDALERRLRGRRDDREGSCRRVEATTARGLRSARVPRWRSRGGRLLRGARRSRRHAHQSMDVRHASDALGS